MKVKDYTGPLVGFLVLAVLCVIAVIVKIFRAGPKHKLRNLPGPIGLPILGYAHVVVKSKNPWNAFSDLRKTYGDIYRIQLGSRNCVVVSSLDAIKDVLMDKQNRFGNRPDFLRFHAIFKGNRNFSIALCDWSSKQKTRRHLAFPFMHPRLCTNSGMKMNQQVITELSDLITVLSAVQNRVIDPRFYLQCATANIFYQFICNRKYSYDNQHFQRIVKVYDAVFQELFQGFAIDFLPWLRVFNQKKINDLETMAKDISEFNYQIFKEHEIVFNSDPQDMVDVLLEHILNAKEDEESLTKEEAAVIIEDLIGGHSVVGNLWLWGLYFLGDHPEVREKIRNEVTCVTKNLRQPSMEDRYKMPYTVATTLELMRVITSPIIPHVTSGDAEIQGYYVPEDTMVLFNTYDLNMDPKYWEKPRSFMPERFLNEQGEVQKPQHFFPFSTGKRTCLGDGLVNPILFLGMSTLLQTFDIILPTGTKGPDIYEIPGMIIPTTEIKLIFTPLTNRQL